MTTLKISVLGAGAWGTALAIQAARAGHAVHLWGRDAAAMAQMQASRRNATYLPDSELPPALALGSDFAAAAAHAADGLTIIATPMSGLRGTLAALPATQRVLWLCKGFEAGTGRLGHEIARELQPGMRVGVLSGPSFAQEVAAGRPTALVAASGDEALAQAAIDAFHGERLRVYTSSDPVGVEVGGAVKNVMAIAVGVCDGLSGSAPDAPGLNARAALITRGLAEMLRLPGPGRQGGDLHGPVGSGRPGAHGHGRPVPQPPRGPVAGAGARAAGDPRAARPCGRGRLQRADGA